MKPQSLKSVKLLILFLCLSISLVPNAFGDVLSYTNRANFEAAMPSFTNIDFEGIATLGGEAGIVKLNSDEFACSGLTLDLVNSYGDPSVGIPEGTFWQDFTPTSGVACLAPDDTGAPNGVIRMIFSSPVTGVGANFLSATSTTSKILVQGDGLSAEVRIPGGASPQQFIGIIDTDGRIESAYFYISYPADGNGAAIDDLIFEQIGSCVQQVEINIRPYCQHNIICLRSWGTVPVAILSSEDFDATTVDPATVELAGAGVAYWDIFDIFLACERDVNRDGLVDLFCRVEIKDIDPGQIVDGYAFLSGSTYDGQEIEGSDEVILIEPPF
ncbi:MAG: hypothetical protein JXA81_04865 [Sedimentisphaerales bacterium]|nr:hypothetical protein [Sedimentisphaerales bacterium]